ncbi:hypothetical protein MD484_g8932, partial [Candolleomyces efflorescens]
MSELTPSGRGRNRGQADSSERGTPIPSRAASPGTDSSSSSFLGAWADRKVRKGKAKMKRGVQKVERGVHAMETGVKSLFHGRKPRDEGARGSESAAQRPGVDAGLGDEETATAGESGAVGTFAGGAAVGANQDEETETKVKSVFNLTGEGGRGDGGQGTGVPGGLSGGVGTEEDTATAGESGAGGTQGAAVGANQDERDGSGVATGLGGGVGTKEATPTAGVSGAGRTHGGAAVFGTNVDEATETNTKSMFNPKDEGEKDSGGGVAAGSSASGNADCDVVGMDEGTVGTLAGGAAVGTNLGKEVVASEFEDDQEMTSLGFQHQGALALEAKDDHTLAPKTETTLSGLMPVLGYDLQAAAAHVTDSEATRMELGTMGGASQAQGFETKELLEAASSEALQPQTAFNLGVTNDDDGFSKPAQLLENDIHSAAGSSAPLSGTGSGKDEKSTPMSSSFSRALPILKGSLKVALDIAATFVPDPFKGPVEMLTLDALIHISD